MTKEIAKEFGTVYERLNDIEKRLSDFTNTRVESVTPYTETKTAYIGDTEVTFTDVPQGNITIYFDKPYTVDKLSDRVTVHFDALEEVIEITISIIK